MQWLSGCVGKKILTFHVWMSLQKSMIYSVCCQVASFGNRAWLVSKVMLTPVDQRKDKQFPQTQSITLQNLLWKPVSYFFCSPIIFPFALFWHCWTKLVSIILQHHPISLSHTHTQINFLLFSEMLIGIQGFSNNSQILDLRGILQKKIVLLWEFAVYLGAN